MAERSGSGGSSGGSGGGSSGGAGGPPKEPAADPARGVATELARAESPRGLGGDWALELSADLEVDPLSRSFAGLLRNAGEASRAPDSVDLAPPAPKTPDLRAMLAASGVAAPASTSRLPPEASRVALPSEGLGVDMLALLERSAPLAPPPSAPLAPAPAPLEPQRAAADVDMRSLLLEGTTLVEGGASPVPRFERTERIDRDVARRSDRDLETEVKVAVVSPSATPPRGVPQPTDTGDIFVVPVPDSPEEAERRGKDTVEQPWRGLEAERAAAAAIPRAAMRAPGFADGPVERAVDPWTDITPTDGSEGDEVPPPREVETTDTVRAFGGAGASPSAPLGAQSGPAPRGDPPLRGTPPALRGTDPDSARDREPRGDPPLRGTPPALRGTDPDSARDRDRDREPRPMASAIVDPAFVADAEEASGGDGPFASPVDAPARPKGRVTRTRPISELAREGIANAFSAPLVVQRRTTKVDPAAKETALVPALREPQPPARAPQTREVVPPDPAVTSPGERRYPKMRALLANPDQVPHGSAPPKRTRAPAVPGTFFPAQRREAVPARPRGHPADLDEMLSTMAEGLLIGEDASGQTEVRVTLRDEFFAGTELRIVAGRGRVRAVLVPPDRSTYLTLNGNLDELRQRLEARGLQIEELRVAEP